MLNSIPQLTAIAILLPIWLVLSFAENAHYLAMWQLKSYRPDRISVIFKHSTWKSLFLPHILYSRMLFAGMAAYAFFIPKDSSFQSILLCALFFSEVGMLFYALFCRELKRPRTTLRSSAIIFFAVCFDVLFFLNFFYTLFFIIFLPILRFGLVTALVIFSAIPRMLYVRFLVYRAKRKLARYPSIIRIGITGSYGKTSTKTFLAHLLSSSFRVISTPENNNSDIGIARFILDTPFDGVQVCVIEMGAYGRGDIDFYCSFVRPHIGILTGINEQHAALMGSISAIKETKIALLRSLPKDGVAIYTVDTEHTDNLPLLQAKTVLTYGRQSEKNPTLFLKKTVSEGQKTFATFVLKEKEYSVTLPFPVSHYADNLCGGILCAIQLGIPMDLIEHAVATLPLPTYGIVVRPFGKKGIIILDYYNANPHGVISALQMLNEQAGDRRKVVITRGLIELGKSGDSANRKFGAAIAESEAELCIIAPDEQISLEQGFRSAGGHLVHRLFDPGDVVSFLKDLADKNTAVLIANRVHSDVMKVLYALR